MNRYYKDHYDAVIIGASLAGLSSALTLLDADFDVLVLEQHNLPGGVATSFVRRGVELEASLHEMISIGEVECPLRTREYFKKHNIDVDWIQIPYAFRYVSNKINVLVRTGSKGDFTLPSQDIAKACDDKDGSIFSEVKRFFEFCNKMRIEVEEVSHKHLPKMEMVRKHGDFVKVLGYSYKEVLDTFKLPERAKEILSSYWMYLGSPVSEIPFIVYAYMIADYVGYGVFIPRHTSHEMSLKMAEAVLNKGGMIEYAQRVDKILVKDNKVQGVRLTSGIEISADYVLSGAYPNTVYSKMIEPKNEVPKKAIQVTNAMDIGVSCFSIVMILDKDYQELGIKDYTTFFAPCGFDSEKFFESGKRNDEWNFITSVCSNVVHKDATPKGTCFYSITYLPSGESFKDMTLENYEEYKRKNIDHFLKMESQRLGVDLKEHILEMVIETPISISHYTGAYLGSIYGYRHTMDNSAAAREEMEKDEQFIQGLYFSGAHQIIGDGMSPAIFNGKLAAEMVVEDAQRKVGK